MTRQEYVMSVHFLTDCRRGLRDDMAAVTSYSNQLQLLNWAIPLFNRTPLQMTINANVYPRDN